MVASQLSSISGVALSPSKPMYSSIESSKASRRTSLIVHAKKTPFKVPKQAVKAKYDKNAKDTSTPLSAFTRKREVFAGRLAMSGFLAGTIGELLTGKGFLGQLSLQTNLPPVAVKGIVAAIVAFNVLTALNPLSETFSESNQRDVAKRPRGPTQNPKINPIENPTEFLGIDKGFGFTRRNELFVGKIRSSSVPFSRVAMLGFASAIIGEQLTNGKGPLAQIGLGIGQPLNTELAGAGLFLWIGVFAVAAIGYGTTDDARFLGETDGDKRIY